VTAAAVGELVSVLEATMAAEGMSHEKGEAPPGARRVCPMSALVDAWRLIVPLRGDKHGPLSPLLLVLTIVTGLVDAFSYLSLGHVFVANSTGNVVFLAFALAGAHGFSSASSEAGMDP
jgi:hypothetical protein